MKTVLIPVDFSKVAHKAMNFAVDYFSNEAINYILLNAFNVEPGQTVNYEEEKTQHQLRLNEEVAFFKGKVNSQSIVSSILWMGKINYLPQEIIDENSVDLVLMGTRGLSEVEEYIGKSNAGEFVLQVDVNTLIIPADCNYKLPKNILFTTDYKNVKNSSTLNELKFVLDKFNANLFVLYVNKTGAELSSYQADIKKQLQNTLEDCKVSFHEFSADDVEEEIENFMLQYNIDMVSAIPMHNTFFDRLFHKSLAKKLAEHATKPLLILTNKHRE